MEKTISSYPKVWAMGHKGLGEVNILEGPNVAVQEKIDGSQFSFMIDHEANLSIRSKGKQLDLAAPEPMFKRGVETVRAISHRLQPGWVYRSEFLSSPHHNTLTYERAPEGFIIGYDVETGPSRFLEPLTAREEFERIGLEFSPIFFWGSGSELREDGLRAYLEKRPWLGGKDGHIEGIVIKNYDQINQYTGKVVMAKMVRDDYLETHKKEWKEKNPPTGDFIDQIIAGLQSEARWAKAVQHLTEDGCLEGSPRDIPALMNEVKRDIKEEEALEIGAALFAHFERKILNRATKDVPSWYKRRLASEVFDESK